MRVSSLGLALVALLLPCASYAVNLNNDSTGQVLIYPYYSVQNGNQTLISVLNFSTLGKAVKVRFREGRNSRAAFSFNLYLGPEDVWTGAIFDTDNVGPGALISIDRSCTAPEFSSAPERLNGLPYVSFSNINYVNPSDGGPATIERTREGFVEVLEMGTILADSELARLISQADAQANACAQVAQRWAQSGNSAPFEGSIVAASGGLIGTGAIVDVANGSYIDYSAQALDGFYRSSMHTRPDSLLPSLASADPRSIVLHEGKAIQSQWGSRGEDAVSSVLMAEQLRNEFTTETALNGSTEWVITFPTKAFYVETRLTDSPLPIEPFLAFVGQGVSCEYAHMRVHDRESGRIADPGSNINGITYPLSTLCFSVNVLTLSQSIVAAADLSSSPSALLGSKLARSHNPSVGPIAVRSGRLTVDLTQHVFGNTGRFRKLRPSLEGNQFFGLPALGFAAVRLENRAAAPGLRAVYGGAFVHKRKTYCVKVGENGGAVGECQ